ncbi:putative insertion element ISCmi3 transposase [Clavibacter sepedonicus]|uniref:Insertion element ISCmi3 transposase n=3 Tax=Microbacteriaceae TaxID=85023 RepID=B0RCA1_CLASE|nr:putative insertion element ISCmi3 transposase [Clavibacter sepedonicus]CAQ01098.1 putative insertion element ISCmi3 transposase [Clavibacter sepedonicus]CAQ01213.1 putative insertion element ISCmi3 transposase [Clavibacter sepedonicus]CAQ01965.1 putative insertion element ISCmi3 transposase [Clavibacter sepedonicus]CAQ02989.1 putative insertion element ISCmi3 transposase [Clavibacter sepedonicus]
MVGVSRNTAYGWARTAGVRGRGKSGTAGHPGRGEYERLRVEGMSRRVAASRVGVHERTAQDWDRGWMKRGSVRIHADGRRIEYNTGMATITGPRLPAVDAVLHPRFLTVIERETIADLRRQDLSLRAIGRVLGRPASTIKRELDARTVAGTYQPHAAHRAWAASRSRPKRAKLAQDGPLRDYVARKLMLRWSPEQISRLLVREFPGEESMRVSTETIYQAIYVQARGGLRREVADALRTGRTRRRPRTRPEHRTQRFVDPMVMIADRPAEIEDRAVPGHWEGDLIVGTSSQSAIVTLVERTTRYVMLGHLPGGHTAEEVRDVLVPLISTLPAHLRGSLTWDQGAEMASHRQISIQAGIPVYFCDPHSPWQRGSNENTNGLLRQYFPKGTDLAAHTSADLEHVAQQLNGRPRKTLDWDTPAERMRALLTTI